MTTLEDRYELGEQLGSGGMARVYAAVDRQFDRDVAIKLVGTDRPGEPSLRARLLREARAAASFNHPCAVTVYDVGEDGGEPFIVMELVQGRSLAQELARRGALPVDEALMIADRVLAALQAAHRHGLVHRDVKPGNVLLSDGGDVKLADFGIAKDAYGATSALTVTGLIVGTPRYLAPEQAAGQPATPQTDLYATGLLLFEMLAGRAPFEASSAVAVALAHQQLPPPPLAAQRPDVPGWLEAVVQRALSKAPQDRFPSAGAFRAALRGRARAAGGPAIALTRWRRRQQEHRWWAHLRSRQRSPSSWSAAAPGRAFGATIATDGQGREGAPTMALAVPPARRRPAGSTSPGAPARAARPWAHRTGAVLAAVLAALLLVAASGLSLQSGTAMQSRVANPSLAPSGPAPATLPALPSGDDDSGPPEVTGERDEPAAPERQQAADPRQGAAPERQAGPPDGHPHGGPPGQARGRGSGRQAVPEHAAASDGPPGLRGHRGRRAP